LALSSAAENSAIYARVRAAGNTAKAIGLTMPEAFLLRADEIIE